MLSKRTIIGFVVGSVIIGIGGFSLILHIGTITINEDYVVALGDSTSYTIPAPAGTPQHMEISGDAFNLKLQSPDAGLQIPENSSDPDIPADSAESFKDRVESPLIIDWVHLADGETRIFIQNTGNTELTITGTLIRSFDPLLLTFDLMVIISGMVIIGFSMGFTLRRPKGF